MRAKTGCLCLLILLAAAAAAAQQAPKAPDASQIYCSGIVTTEQIPTDSYLISGEQSNYKLLFAQGELVYLNRGASQGVKMGDEYLVTRAVKEPLRYRWFRWQMFLLRAMGTMYQDLGKVRVVHVEPNVAIAEVLFSCDYMQRGDIVRPFTERPAPPFKAAADFDRFAPASGKNSAMVVATKNFGQVAGTNTIVYVNLGASQGVKVGDYFRFFHYQGTRAESAYQSYGTAYKIYGFGRTPGLYSWGGLPREILGEGIVLRVSPNASTVMVTLSLREVYVGSYVEIE